MERIRANSLRQTQLLIDGADARGFGVRSPREPERRGGTVTVNVPDFEAVHKELVGAADPLRLPPGRRHSPRPALLHERRRARARARPDRGHSRDGRARTLARSDSSLLDMSGVRPRTWPDDGVVDGCAARPRRAGAAGRRTGGTDCHAFGTADTAATGHGWGQTPAMSRTVMARMGACEVAVAARDPDARP